MCQWKWGGIYFDCIYSLFLLVATLLLEPATVTPWIAAVPELGSSLFVPVFKTILQQINKPLYRYQPEFTNCPLGMDLNTFRRWKDTLWPKADTLDVHTLLTSALFVNCSARNPLFVDYKWITNLRVNSWCTVRKTLSHCSLVRIPHCKCTYACLCFIMTKLLIRSQHHRPFNNSYSLPYRLRQLLSKWWRLIFLSPWSLFRCWPKMGFDKAGKSVLISYELQSNNTVSSEFIT